MTNQRGKLMTNFENLNERVGNVVDKFHHSEELPRSENKSLSRILNELETKFEALTAELDDCQSRITGLEDSNVSLNALVCQVVDLVEKLADEITQDPFYRASAAASDIVSRYVDEAPADEEAAAVSAPAPAPALEQGPRLQPQRKRRPRGVSGRSVKNSCSRKSCLRKPKGLRNFRSSFSMR